MYHFFHAVADEAATVRVTNLSEDTQESDLQELFRPFGQISRIYLAKDKITNQSKVRHLSNACNLLSKANFLALCFVLDESGIKSSF